jgi:hypothetical protein
MRSSYLRATAILLFAPAASKAFSLVHNGPQSSISVINLTWNRGTFSLSPPLRRFFGLLSWRKKALPSLSMSAYPAVILGLLYALATPSAAQEVGGGNLAYEQFFGSDLTARFGYSVARAGDVNNDGTEDYIIGAIGVQVGLLDGVGAAYVYSGADASILHTFTGTNAGGNFGFSVDGAGDVDGDGYDDVIIGAPYVGPGASPREGRAFVYSGFDGHKIFRFDGANAEDRLGFSVAGAGDVNGDGLDDVLVGSIWSSQNGLPESGSADLFSGANGQAIYHWDGGSPRDYLGYSVAGAGDVNNDGVPDLLVGVPSANPGGVADAGRVFVYSGATGKKIYRLDGTAAYDWLGFSVSAAGDIDGDGYDDILAGAPLADPSGIFDAGSALIYSGQTGAIIFQHDGTTASENVGIAVAGNQDMDRDGTPDLVVGAPGADPGGQPYTGSAIALSGIDGSQILQTWGNAANDQLGHAVAMLPNLYRYQHSEILVGAHGFDFGSQLDAGWAGVVGYSRYISKDFAEVSAATGATVTFTLQFPLDYAQEPYKLLGSATGKGPTELAGLQVPLTSGDFLWDALYSTMPPSLFTNVNGTLTAGAEAQCTMTVPPGFASSFVGRSFYFAAVIYQPPATGLVSSAAIMVTVAP